MRFHCKQPETVAQYRARVQSWRPWFAWRPVRVGPTECRWLEWVERKAVMCCADDFYLVRAVLDMPAGSWSDACSIYEYEYRGRL
jgi:hypothetical protein